MPEELAATAPHPERHVALKVDVDTLRGTLEGVPALAALFARLNVGATFYFSVGPDHTGRALRRVFRRGFLSKVRRTSVTSHYGLATLLYGTLLPGPDIGARAGAVMRAVRDQGFEVGLHSYDHVRWQDNVRAAGAAWTRRELERGMDAFAGVFGAPPRSHAAAGWQLNAAALALEPELGFEFASDTRGSCPFYPSLDGVEGRCLQIPTTLPTLDELIGLEGRDARAAAEEILRITRVVPCAAHVFTLHAELEGMRLLPQLEWLLGAWLEDGCTPLAMGALHARLTPREQPRHRVAMEEIPGRSGVLAVQGGCIAEPAEPPAAVSA
ncbi:MAG TPA: polysaccharide deacetylase family protein [Steroidobacteraceae bacterium]|nr:polysaccharide deacetylase family protein [Steroidobacteraceae bacterium]